MIDECQRQPWHVGFWLAICVPQNLKPPNTLKGTSGNHAPKRHLEVPFVRPDSRDIVSRFLRRDRLYNIESLSQDQTM